MNSFSNEKSGTIIIDIAQVINQNKAHLSEIDGKIGDGDHGVNMAKGFNALTQRLENKESSLAQAMKELSDILMAEIGGSMGPLYGMMFANMADFIKDRDEIDAAVFLDMLNTGLTGVQEIGSAQLGDKTLLDCFIPAIEAFETEINKQSSFKEALQVLKQAATAGRDSTVDMIAKVGRASRLGERSCGVADAGATSCCLILNTLADSISQRL